VFSVYWRGCSDYAQVRKALLQLFDDFWSGKGNCQQLGGLFYVAVIALNGEVGQIMQS
jgi:hypothetical protein